MGQFLKSSLIFRSASFFMSSSFLRLSSFLKSSLFLRSSLCLRSSLILTSSLFLMSSSKLLSMFCPPIRKIENIFVWGRGFFGGKGCILGVGSKVVGWQKTLNYSARKQNFFCSLRWAPPPYNPLCFRKFTKKVQKRIKSLQWAST